MRSEVAAPGMHTARAAGELRDVYFRVNGPGPGRGLIALNNKGEQQAAAANSTAKQQEATATAIRCGEAFFNYFFTPWDPATKLPSHSKSTKQSLNY